MNKYICLDTETGGVTNDSSLLSVHFRVFSLPEELKNSSSLSLELKPDDGVYRACGEALRVNNINLAEHDKKAIAYSEAKPILFEFLRSHSNGGKDKLIPLGHNVAFDIAMVTNNIISKSSWNNFVSYRSLDTGCVAQFLIAAGMLDGAVTSGSMESLSKIYSVDYRALGYDKPQPHSARYDVDMTIGVFLEMLNDMKSLQLAAAIGVS